MSRATCACGGEIVVEGGDTAAAVRAHQETPEHETWRATEWMPDPWRGKWVGYEEMIPSGIKTYWEELP